MYKLLITVLLCIAPAHKIASQEPTLTKPLPLISNRSSSENPPDISFKYDSYQATFLRAKAAQVSQTQDSVLIEVQELQSEILVGVVLSFEGLTSLTIEVTTLLELNGITVGSFPPQLIKPNEYGNYPITGTPGSKFGVRVETIEGTRFITAKIDGDTLPPPIDPPSPDPPPTTDLSKITTLVASSVATLNDPTTVSHLQVETKKLLDNFPTDISLAKESLKNAISTALLDSMVKLKPPYKDWKGTFRVPLDNAIVEISPTTPQQLKEIVEAMYKGLLTPTTSLRSIDCVGPNCPPQRK